MIDREDGIFFEDGAGEGRLRFHPAPLSSRRTVGIHDRKPAAAAGSSPLAERARLVLEIVPGERRREPAFGCRIHLLPEIETEEERQIAAALVEESLETWAPALGVERAIVSGIEDGAIRLSLRKGGAWHPLSISHRRGAKVLP